MSGLWDCSLLRTSSIILYGPVDGVVDVDKVVGERQITQFWCCHGTATHDPPNKGHNANSPATVAVPDF
jgi:hypothetical protein